MRKLRLDIGELRVESFEANALSGRGTLRGHEFSEHATNCGACNLESTFACQLGTFAGDTCDNTCNQIACGATIGGPENGTCDATCHTGCVPC